MKETEQKMRMVSTGYGSFVSLMRLLAVIPPEAAPTKRLIQDAKDRGLLVDVTAGKRTHSVLLMDSGQVILSALDCDKILEATQDKEVDSFEK